MKCQPIGSTLKGEGREYMLSDCLKLDLFPYYALPTRVAAEQDQMAYNGPKTRRYGEIDGFGVAKVERTESWLS